MGLGVWCSHPGQRVLASVVVVGERRGLVEIVLVCWGEVSTAVKPGSPTRPGEWTSPVSVVKLKVSAAAAASCQHQGQLCPVQPH